MESWRERGIFVAVVGYKVACQERRSPSVTTVAVSAISREATVYGEGGSPGEGWHAQQKKRATPELAELRRHSWDFRF